MTSATPMVEAAPLAYRAERWKLNSDNARVSVPLGELRGIVEAIRSLTGVSSNG